jgi:hypothetical protein
MSLFATLGGSPGVLLCWHPRFAILLHALPLCGTAPAFGCLPTLDGSPGLLLASAFCYRASCVAPVRGGTYFSLPPQRKVGESLQKVLALP